MKHSALINHALRIGGAALLAAVLIGAWRGCLYDFSAFSAMEKIGVKSRKVSLEGVRLIKADIKSGTVSILSAADKNLRIKLKGPPKTDESHTFTLTEKNGVIEVRDNADASRAPFLGLGAWERDLELYIPDHYRGDLAIKSADGGLQSGGDLRLGAVTLDFGAGNIRIGGTVTAKDFTLKSASGDLILGKIACENRLEISSGAGGLTADSLEAAEFSLRADAGSLTVEALRGAGRLETSSGRLTAGVRALAGDLFVVSGSGRVSLGFLKNAAFDVRADSDSGDIRVRAGEYSANAKKTLAHSVGKRPQQTVTVRTGSGGICIERE